MLDLLLGNRLLALFLVIAFGMVLGRVRVGGASFGSSAVIFTALGLGYLGYEIPSGVGTLGLVLFIYCIGIAAGPTFFRSFARHGKDLALLAVGLVLVGAAATYALARLAAIPADLAVGVFAGAMTSTPGLAAAVEALPAGSQAAVGYGLAYPLGVVAVVLFVQLLPRLLRADLNALAQVDAAQEDDPEEVVRTLVEVINDSVAGKSLRELPFISDANCLVTRVLAGNCLIPVTPDLVLQKGQHLLLVGPEEELALVVEALGRRSQRTDFVMDTEQQRMSVVVTSRNIVGRTLAEIDLRRRMGINVARICRYGVELVPRPDEAIQYGEALTVIGEPTDLHRFTEFAGHRPVVADKTDVLSVCLGVAVGILVGMVSFGLGDSHYALGLAGGPLLVALLLGHVGRIGPIVGHVPRASRLLMQEIGLVFFLASAGVNAGGQLVPVLREHSGSLLAAAATIALAPMVFGYIFARFALKMTLPQILGGICGSMTSTPGLGVVTAKTDAQSPVLAYAVVYPISLILITIVTRGLVLLLG